MAENNTTPDATPQDEPKPRKRRRRWPYVIIGILVLLLILVLLIPTIASTAPVRSFVVSKVNANLNGTLAINDWSIGWTSGVTIDGVKIDDEKGVRVLEVSSIRVPMSLLAAARGNYDLGEVVIDRPNLVNVVVYEDGSTNLERLAKDTRPEPESDQPTEFPDVKGKITINALRGTISGPQLAVPIIIEPSDIKVDIPDINQAIANDGALTYRVGSSSSPSTISFAGKIDVIENNKVDLDKLSADQQVTLNDVDFAAVSPFLGQGTTLAGLANGNLKLTAQGVASTSANGKLTIANFAYGGAALKGDTYKSSQVDIPIDVITADSVVKVSHLQVATDHLVVNVSGELPQRALENALANKAPGSTGGVTLTLNTKDLKGLTNQFRNTLALQQDVQIESGKLDARVDIALAPQNITIKQNLDLEAAGTNAGKPVRLDPVHLETSVTALPNGQPIPDLRDIALNLTSAFATATGGGKSLDDLNINGNLDLAKLHAQLAQFQDLGGQTFAGSGTFQLALKGNLTEPGGKSEVSANLAFDNLRIRHADGGSLRQQRVELNADANVALGADENAPTNITFSSLSASTADNVFALKQVEQTPLVVSLGKEATTASGQLALSSNLKRLLDTLNTYNNAPALSPNDPGQLQSGNFAGTIKLTSTDKGADINLDGVIDNLTITTAQQPITNEKLTIALAASATPDFKRVTIPSSTINSSFANTTIKDALLDLDGQALDMLQRADVQVAVPDLNKAMAVSQAFSPPATQPTTQPINISGQLAVDLHVRRDQATQTTNVNIPQLVGTQISLARGLRRYAFDENINVKLTAALASAGGQLNKIDVKQLEGDLGGLATLAMPQPISITNLSADTPNANGRISISGALEPLTRVLAVIQDADPMPYRGDYAVTQNVATTAGRIHLSGDATINKLVVLDASNQPAFSEDKLVLANDILADTNAKTATINNLALDMTSSKAAGLIVKGAVQDWETKRQLEQVSLALAYDLAKLWPMIKPMLAPETQQQLADLKIAGKFNRTFNITGSYPAKEGEKELAFHESIRSLNAMGAIAVKQLSTNGIDLTDFELPLTLASGQLATVYGDRPRGERTAKPANFNGGTLDLNSILIDLTQETPRLAIGKNQPLVRNAAINELLMRFLGKYANSFFANSQQAQGKLDVTMEYCENVPLGDLATDTQGRAKMVFSLSDMHIVNPIGEEAVRSIVSQMRQVQQIASLVQGLDAKIAGDPGDVKTFAGRISNATITLANGKITQDITMQLVDTDRVYERTDTGATTRRTEQVIMPLTIRGDVTLANLAQNLDIEFPVRIIARAVSNEDLEKAMNDIFPKGVPFRLAGTTSAYQLLPPSDLVPRLQRWAVRHFIDKQAGGAIGDIGKIGDILRPPPQPQQQNQPVPSQTTQPALPAQPDPVGTIFDILGGREKKDESRQEPATQPAPRRRR